MVSDKALRSRVKLFGNLLGNILHEQATGRGARAGRRRDP